MDRNPPQPPVKLVRSYNKLPPPPIVPVITSFASASPPEIPVTPSPSSASTQPSLRAARRTQWQKIDDVLRTYGFPNLGDFLACLFHPCVRGEKDPRTQRHRQAVGAFLQGKSTVKMADLIESLYHHPKSRPRKTLMIISLRTSYRNSVRPTMLIRLGYATRRQSRILPRWETRTKESGGREPST
ncbi:hypothetical protein B0H14DRAFT_2658967 [Mycena olivaceomarginata]|nr:hypothetical protein B0H14DRAFT_2658967 [Mycena olivaceomarginata]